MVKRALATLAVLAVAACPPAAPANEPLPAATSEARPPLRRPDVIFVATPQPVVDAMLRLAAVREGDVLYDLGSGDGRIPITAAREYGVRAVGIDIDPLRIREADANSRAAGTSALATFRNEDLFEADISEATVVTLYLLSHLNEKLLPKLVRELRPGTRIVSHTFGIGDWVPERRADVAGRSVYLWRLPQRRWRAASRPSPQDRRPCRAGIAGNAATRCRHAQTVRASGAIVAGAGQRA
jgi:SAM-dependent methyltransferase